MTDQAAFPFLTLFLVCKVGIWLWEEYLNYRNKKKKRDCKMPPELEGKVSDEVFTRSQDYTLTKLRFHTVKDAINLGFILIFFTSGAFSYCWDKTKVLATLIHLNPESDVIRGLILSIGGILFSTVWDAPFEAYSHFVIEQKYGFNKTTIGLFFKDRLISVALGIVLTIPILSGLLVLINWGGEYFWFYIWVFVLLVQLFLLTIYPTLIAPLFNKFTELEEGELRESIHQLSKSVSFPLTKIYVMDASKRTTHSNAYYYGFGANKRIVLFDTLKSLENAETLSVLSHELGHWNYMHPLKIFFINAIHFFVLFFIFGYFKNNQDLCTSFGFDDGTSTFITLVLFIYFYFPVETILTFLIIQLLRCFEEDADRYASRLGYGETLRTALLKLYIDNKSDFDPDSWYSTYHFSHPTLLERLRLLGKLETQEKKEH